MFKLAATLALSTLALTDAVTEYKVGYLLFRVVLDPLSEGLNAFIFFFKTLLLAYT